MVAELSPASSRRRLQVLAALCATAGGLAAVGLLLVGLWLVGFALGIAITLALVSALAQRTNVRGASAILLAYAFAWGLFIWAGLFLIALAVWHGWR